MIYSNIKKNIVIIGGLLSSVLGPLAIPVYLLFGFEILDYITGIAAAPYRGEKRSSQIGMQGIVKKICILMVVAIAAGVDTIVKESVATVGIALPFSFPIADLTAVWLVCNEVISVLENIGDIGVKLPPFLSAAAEWVKKSTEDRGEQSDDNR